MLRRVAVTNQRPPLPAIDVQILPVGTGCEHRYRLAFDLPMIDTVLIEVANPRHPYGVRGVGEVPIVPPIPALANAIHDALGIRFYALPMSPPRVLEAIEARG